MLDMWTGFFINAGMLSILLIIATLLRSKVKFIQNFFIPNSIIAGFLGLILGSQVLKIFNLDQDALKNYIYHLLAIVFIAIALKKSDKASGKNSVRTCFMFALGYCLQGLIGFGSALFILSKLFPAFNPVNGILVMLGFSNSPSLAFSVAEGWKTLLLEQPGVDRTILQTTGIIYSSDIGLTFGALGFIIACIVGIIVIRYGVKKGYTTYLKDTGNIGNAVKKGYYSSTEEKKEAGKLTTSTEAIDSLSLHLAIVLAIYVVTYYFLKLILLCIGYLPEQIGFLAKVIVNYHFIIAALFAMIVKKILGVLKLDFILDNGLLERISGTSVDYMVTAALSAISLAIVAQFIIPIIVIAVIVALITFLYCLFFGSRSFDNYKFERIVTIFGIATGTLATGMALLRVLDPEFKSPVAKDIMYGSALVFFFTMPIMILINLPLRGIITGNTMLNPITLLIVILYTLGVIVLWRVLRLIKFKRPLGKLLHMDEKS